MTGIETHESALKQELLAFQAAPVVAVDPPAPRPHITFASAWPAAREALLLLGTLVPASVRMIIGIVTSVGDTMTGTVRAN